MAQWEHEKLFFSGDEFFRTIIENIRSAKISIDLETYIFALDTFTKTIELELINAAKRGVKVRILVDGIGSMSWLGRWNAELLTSGCEVRVFHPVRFSLFEASRVFLRINQRDHRKVWLIDGVKAWVGSMNITSEHLREFRGDAAWRDTSIEVSGESLWILREAFQGTWNKSEPYPRKASWRSIFKLRKPLPKNSIVRLNDSRRLRKAGTLDLRRRVRSAATRVWITNPYFAPNPFFLSALITAKHYGCDVKLLVPTVSDVFFMKWVAQSYYGALLKVGVEVFEYQPRFLHAKSVIIDNWATVGTSNLNTRSFRHDLEVDLVVTMPATLETLVSQFQNDLRESRQIGLQEWHRERWLNRLGRVIAYLFGKWI